MNRRFIRNRYPFHSTNFTFSFDHCIVDYFVPGMKRYEQHVQAIMNTPS